MSAEAPERSSGRHLSIGEVLAQLRGEFPDITISKIRFLESQGLIDPERTPSGYRKFYPPDLERLRWILYQQRDHFLPLRVIKDRLDAYGPEGAPAIDSGSRASGNGPSTAPRPTAPPAVRPERAPAQAPTARPEPKVPSSPDPDTPERPRPADRPPVQVTPIDKSPERPPVPPPTSTPEPRPPVDRPHPAEATSRAQHPAGSERPSPPPPPAPVPAPAVKPAPQPAAQPAATPAPTPSPAGPPPSHAPQQQARDGRPAAPPRREPRPPEPPPKPDLPFDDFVDAAEDRDEKLGPIRRSDTEPTSKHMTRAELLEATGLTEAQLDALEEFGLVVPLMGEGERAHYDDEALNIAEIGSGFYARGIEARHLKMYWYSAEREAGIFYQRLIGHVRQRNPAARKRLQEDLEALARLGRQLRTAMLRRALGESLSE